MINKNIEKVRVCYRCHSKVYQSLTKGYPYQCFVHDEDLFEIETIEISKEDYLQSLAKKLHCSIDKAEVISNEYDNYIQNALVTENIYPLTIKKFYAKKKLLDKQIIT